jgi:hypothetical protein
MGGRAILIIVLGFSITLLTIGSRFGKTSNDSVTNYTNYYFQQMAHNIAISGANLAANQFYLASNWTAGINNLSLGGGTVTVTMTIPGDPLTNLHVITSTGTYRGVRSTVTINFVKMYFSRYAYCSNNENGVWWANQDTVIGPFHTQDYLNVYGTPHFNPTPSFVGTYKGINKYNSTSSPIVTNNAIRIGDYQTISQSGVSTLESNANSGGYTFTGHDTVYLTFAVDSIRYKFSYKTAWTTKKTSTFAPNGSIVADNAILRIQGTIAGQLTVGASYNTKGGTIYIDGDVLYKNDPLANPASTDLLGIVAQNNIYVTNNAANNNSVSIDAALYAQSGGFGAEDYSTRPKSGYIYLLGGITQYSRLPVGTLDSRGNISTGFSKRYDYDTRLLKLIPPNFPKTDSYQIISWYE